MKCKTSAPFKMNPDSRTDFMTPETAVALMMAVSSPAVTEIDVTTDADDLVTEVTFTHDDETVSTYTITYDEDEHPISFGDIAINWNSEESGE